jgi:hypothetical protein
VFLKYDGIGEKWEEYCLEWNPEFRMAEQDNVDLEKENQPIRTSRNERLKRIINPLQIKLELMKEQG